MKTGIELIAEERTRQIEVKKYDENHDEEHNSLQLSSAAACCIVSAQNKILEADHYPCFDGTPKSRFQINTSEGKWVDGFPWPEHDKRNKHSEIKSLIIAGALIAAEIDRLQTKGVI